jgi:hypothetical protein
MKLQVRCSGVGEFDRRDDLRLFYLAFAEVMNVLVCLLIQIDGF